MSGIVTVRDTTKLIACQYAIPDQEYSTSTLATILLQITPDLLAEGASVVKAIAILLDKLDIDLHANWVMDTLAEPFGQFIKVGSTVKTHTDNLTEGLNSIDNRVTDIASRIKNIHSAVIEAQTQAKLAASITEDTHTTIQKHIKDNPAPPSTRTHLDTSTHSHNTNLYTYRTHVPAIHDQVMARNYEKLKQVLFTKAQGMTSQGLDTHDPQTIVAKANLALTAMKNRDDVLKGVQFMSAKPLAKGDILFDMDSPESVEWLTRSGIRTEFIQGFGAMSEIKDREHSCVVKNVPINFRPSMESSLEVEITNTIPANSILLARWIKPIERRFVGQRTAYMIITFHTADTANKAIQNNLYICGKQCITRKLLPEPRHCFKCHAINARHIATNCKEITDICGGAHLLRDCNLKDEDPAKHFCVNCKTHGHATQDHLCPTYIQQCNELKTRMPENMYKYFPTDNPDTWELSDPPKHDYGKR